VGTPAGSCPRTSVIIPAYHSWKTLPAVLDALGPQLGCTHEAILVASGAASGERGALAERWPWLRVVVSEPRLYPGSARNLGVAHARGDLLVFLDADAVPLPDWLSRLEGSLSEQVEGVAGGVLNGTPHSRIGTAQHLLEFSEALPRRPRSLRHAVGANLLLRRSCFEDVGGFAEHLRAGEDTLLTFPLARERRLDFCAEARVLHLNRTRLRPFLANQRLQGAAFVQICSTVDYPNGWVGRWPWRLVAGPLSLLALGSCLAVNPAQARQALRVAPELLLGVAAWTAGFLSASSR
jgi:cellulose synthase/poly-beta-1,6-N-acetylglucosamine synthase-like glycosyltransferase